MSATEKVRVKNRTETRIVNLMIEVAKEVLRQQKKQIELEQQIKNN